MPGQYLSPGVYVEEVPPTARPIAGVGTSTAGFIGIVADDVEMPERPGEFEQDEQGNPLKDEKGNLVPERYKLVDAGIPHAVTSWEEFKIKFGDFSEKNKILAHAVYGFFNNGGTRCWVLRVANEVDFNNPSEELLKFEPIDEIAIVAIPGAVINTQHEALVTHCFKMKDRIGILDGVFYGERGQPLDPSNITGIRPIGRTDTASFVALYFPWIKVFDPVTNQPIVVPPCGHIAGIYARNDATRGVFKAPANEAILGALEVGIPISKAHQDVLNPEGINAIRSFNGAIKVWGARTMADEATSQFRYISTRRFFNFLRESIDEGTQFAVFEPNSPSLWQQIKRNVSDFLLGQWRDGALFGETSEKAFFVKCDAETNPPDVRERGMVVTEIGVAIVKPAEFVIFRIQQNTGS